MGYDDRVLGEYLAVFSTAGSIPTSLGGYGFARPLASLGAEPSTPTVLPGFPRQPSGSGSYNGAVVSAAVFQNYLNALKARVTKSGRLDDETVAGWKKYAALFQEPHSNIARAQTPDRLEDPKQVYITAQALKRLKDRATASGNLREEAARPIGSRPGATPTPIPKPTTTTKTATTTKPSTGNVTVSTREIQDAMVSLGVDPARIQDGKYGPTTKAKWEAFTKSRNLNSYISGKSGSTTATVNAATLMAVRAATTAAKPVAAKDLVANTSDVQSILKRLGFRDPDKTKDRLGDGSFGSFTRDTWAQAAAKRNLDPYIVKKTADGKQVTVREETYLKIKADADAKVAPAAPEPVGGTLKTLDPKLVARVPLSQFQEVLTRVSGPMSGTVDVVYAAVAKQLGVDPRIEAEPPSTVLVMQASWAALQKKYAEMATPLPPPGPKKTQLDLAVEALIKGSTSTLTAAQVETAINAAIQDKRIEGNPVAVAPWTPGLRLPLLQVLRIPKDDVPAWEQALVPGKLVSSDGKTVKLPPQAADFLKKYADAFTKAVKAEAERVKGFTEVNAAEVIARINGLGITTKKFDRAGGAKELADAIRTFLDNSGLKINGGELVRTDPQNKTYVKNEVMTALATAVTGAQQRAAATKRFRDSMVANALKSASMFLPVTDLQQAIRHSVLTGGTSGANKKIFDAVQVTGAFDKATRDAYTELTRTLTIGPSVQQYQDLLKTQLGPNFKTALVTEASNQVWNAFLDAAVQKKDGKLSVQILPALGTKLAPLAALYRKNVSADKRAAEQAAAQMKVLDEAVKRSTATLSILDVQQGLLQMVSSGKIKSTGVKLTGEANTQTKDGLFQVSALIFPEGYVLPETMWAAYLKRVGIKVVSDKPPSRTWLTSNYISLPPGLANTLAKEAGAWMAVHGRPQIQVVAFKDPSVITVTVPKKETAVAFTEQEAAKKVVESPQPTAKTGADEQAAALKAAQQKAEQERLAREAAARAAEEARRKAELAAQEAERERLAKEEAARAAAAAQQAAREAQLREAAAREAGAREAAERAAAEAQQAAAVAAQQAAEAQAALAREQAAREEQKSQAETAAQQDTAAQAGGAQVTGPTITITTPTQAGMGAGALGLAAAGVGIVALLMSRKGDQDEGKQP